MATTTPKPRPPARVRRAVADLLRAVDEADSAIARARRAKSILLRRTATRAAQAPAAAGKGAMP